MRAQADTKIVDEMDCCTEKRDDDGLTLTAIAQKNGYSEFHMPRKFKEISGISFRDYLRRRRLAFALIDLRDTEKSILDIAVDYGFSSHEAFCRSFKTAYGYPAEHLPGETNAHTAPYKAHRV